MPEAPQTILSPASVPDEHRKALEFIEDVTANADQVQRRVLAEILAQNAPAEYLHRHGLPSRTAPDPDAFKRLIPVVTYEDIRPDILRIAHGDISPILSGRPISEFLTRFAARSRMYPSTNDARLSLLHALCVFPSARGHRVASENSCP